MTANVLVDNINAGPGGGEFYAENAFAIVHWFRCAASYACQRPLLKIEQRKHTLGASLAICDAVLVQERIIAIV